MTSNSTTTGTDDSTFVFYRYNPSKAAAILFIVLFGLATCGHVFKMIRHRCWYFIPFIIGLVFECLGYVGRAIASFQTPDWTLGPFILQSLTILLGPAFFAATIYMTLGRLLRYLHVDKYSPIRTTWLTKIFVCGDVLSFLVQSGGGGILANANTSSTQKLGQNVILVGLILQILFFGLFIVVTVVVHRRIIRLANVRGHLSFFYVLYAVSSLILVRSIFRVAEYTTGYDGALQSSEVYIYIFDTLLMFCVVVLFYIFHPSAVMDTSNPKTMTSGRNSDAYPLEGSSSSMA